MRSWIAGLLLLMLGVPEYASPCSPCPSELSLSQTIQKADLIVIGTLAKPALQLGPADRQPSFITVVVEKTLKGKASGGRIRVHSFYGMCPFGLSMEADERAVIYLSKVDDGYASVDEGCAYKKTPIVNASVMADGEWMPLADFQSKYLP